MTLLLIMSRNIPEARFIVDSPVGEIGIDSEKLKNLINYIANNVEKVDSMDQSISNFFEVDVDSLEVKQKDYSGKEYIMWAASLLKVMEKHYDIIKIENYKYGDAGTPPIWTEENIRGITHKIPYKLTMFLESKVDKHKLVLSFWPYEQYEIDIKFYFEALNHEIYNKLWEEVKAHFNSQGLLKNEKFSADYNFLEVPAVGWNDIVIDTINRDLLERNIINFIPHIAVYQDNNLNASRGILISGPPGTGKTLCCNVIMNQVGVTTIYVSRNAIKNEGQISRLYKMARHLSPTLVIIEDIDTLGGIDRREIADHPLLGEFLNCLSGVEKNDGVITLATTNYPQHLDWALADRPGRFDTRIEFGYPKDKTRKKILSKYLDPFSHKVDLSSVVKKTEGFSGAYLRETVQNAFMLAFERSGFDSEKSKILQSDVDTALSTMIQQKSKVSLEKGIKDVTEEIYG